MDRNASRRRVVAGLGALLGGGVLAGCAAPTDGDGGETPGGKTTVEMTDELTFVPDQVAVAPGETVVWENVGETDHTVTAYGDRIPDGAAYLASGGFDSEAAARDAYPEGAVGGGETFEHTFETAGTYEYFCIPHEGTGMTGTVEVG